MAELAWCPTCEKWDNLELREAVCDKNGNSICQMCGTTLEEGSGMIETKILSNIQAIERLREIGFRVEIIGYAKDELMEPYQAVIYDPSYQERSWGAFGSTIGEAVDGAIAKFKRCKTS